MIEQIKFLKDFHPFTAGETFQLNNLTLLVGDQGAGKSTLLDLLVKYETPKLAEVNERYQKQEKKRGDFNAQNTKAPEPIIELPPTGEVPKLCYVDTEKHNPRMTHGETTLEYKDAIIEVLRDEALYKLIATMDGYKHHAYKFTNGIKSMEVDELTNRLLQNLGQYFDSKRGGTILGDEVKMDISTAAAATMQSHGQSIFPLIAKTTDDKSGHIILLDEPETALSIRSQHKIAQIIVNLAHRNQVIVATHSPIIMAVVQRVLSLEHRKWMDTAEFLETQKTF